MSFLKSPLQDPNDVYYIPNIRGKIQNYINNIENLGTTGTHILERDNLDPDQNKIFQLGIKGKNGILVFKDTSNVIIDNIGGNTGPIGPTGPTGPSSVLAAARLGVDNSSNPGPINGLLFDPTTTIAGNYAIPLISTSVGAGICDNFLIDDNNYFTLLSPTQLQINITGAYNLSGNVIILSNDNLNPVVMQILRSTDLMFTAPPAMTDARAIVSTGTSPISGLYSNIYTLGFSENCYLLAGDIINMKLYAEGGSGGDTAEISLCSSLSINLIGGSGPKGETGPIGPTGPNSGFTGPTGPTGPAGTSGWLINGNTGLTGINTLGISGGTDIKLYDNTNSIEITGNTNNQSSLSITSLQLGSTIDTTGSTVAIPNYSVGNYIKNTTSFNNLQMPIVDSTPNGKARAFLCTSNISTNSQGGGTVCVSNTLSSDRFLVQGGYSTALQLRPNTPALLVELPSLGAWGTICSPPPAAYYKEFYLDLTPDNTTVTDFWLSMNSVGYIENTGGNIYHGFSALLNGNFNLMFNPPSIRLHGFKINFSSPHSTGPSNGWQIRIYKDNQGFITNPTLPTTLLTTSNFTSNVSSTSFTFNNTIESIAFNYYIRITNIGAGITPRKIYFIVTGSTPGY